MIFDHPIIPIIQIFTSTIIPVASSESSPPSEPSSESSPAYHQYHPYTTITITTTRNMKEIRNRLGTHQPETNKNMQTNNRDTLQKIQSQGHADLEDLLNVRAGSCQNQREDIEAFQFSAPYPPVIRDAGHRDVGSSEIEIEWEATTIPLFATESAIGIHPAVQPEVAQRQSSPSLSIGSEDEFPPLETLWDNYIRAREQNLALQELHNQARIRAQQPTRARRSEGVRRPPARQASRERQASEHTAKVQQVRGSARRKAAR